MSDPNTFCIYEDQYDPAIHRIVETYEDMSHCQINCGGIFVDCACYRWNCDTQECELVLVGCPETGDPCIEAGNCCSYIGLLDDPNCAGATCSSSSSEDSSSSSSEDSSSSSSEDSSSSSSVVGSSSSSVVGSSSSSVPSPSSSSSPKPGSSSSSNPSGSSSSGDCFCSSGWNPADCISVSVSPCFLDDGKLPSGTKPSSVNVKVSKKVYANGELYEHDGTVWKSATNESNTLSVGGLFNFTVSGNSFGLRPTVRYRQLYKDYTIVGFSSCDQFDSCPDYDHIIPCCGGAPCSSADDVGQNPNSVSPFDDFEAFGACLDQGSDFGQCCQSLGCDAGGGAVPMCFSNASVEQECGYYGGSIYQITFGSTCRDAGPALDCGNCVNSPSVDYTTLPSYSGYKSGCTGRPIDIDVDACNMAFKPASFTKGNLVLYYQGGADRPFMVIDDVAYDTRSAGLVKVFTATNPDQMRDMVCSRLRFATLVDESKLSTDIGASLDSNWPYNDLYWFSSCGNLADEVPINLVPC